MKRMIDDLKKKKKQFYGSINYLSIQSFTVHQMIIIEYYFGIDLLIFFAKSLSYFPNLTKR
jgi:hypothetical protein